MDELTHILWDYAADSRLEGCYDQQMKKERDENQEAAGWSREKLEELCPAQALEQVKNLCYYFEVLRAVNMEAAFTCGLRLGLSLR